MSDQSLDSSLISPSYYEKHKKFVLISISIFVLIIILVYPMIPNQITVTETRTKKLLYNSKVYGTQMVSFHPEYVEVEVTPNAK